MDKKDMERLMGVLQAHTIALCALISTHPDAQILRQAFETIADRTSADAETLAALMKSIR